jgi:hypothetical protein
MEKEKGLRFKIGDRVIVTRLTPESTPDKIKYLGQSFEVRMVYKEAKWQYSLKATWMFSDEELELDLAYYSPLGEALR